MAYSTIMKEPRLMKMIRVSVLHRLYSKQVKDIWRSCDRSS